MGGARRHITFYQIPRGWRNGCRLLFFYDHCPTGSLVGSGDYSRIGVDFNLYFNSSIEINRSLQRMTYPLFTRDNCYTDYETLLLPDFVLGANMAAYANDPELFHYENFHKSGFSMTLYQSHH